MRSLAGSLADGVLADAILIRPCSPILFTVEDGEANLLFSFTSK